MYKHASRNLQRRLRVDKPQPTGGYIGSNVASEQDLIPNAGNLSLGQCRDELRQLGVELSKIENALAVAKREKDKGQLAFIGQSKASVCARRSTIKTRIREHLQDKDYQLLKEAVEAVCDEDSRARIFAHARDARNAFIGAAE